MTSLQHAGSDAFEIDGERCRYHSIPALARLPGFRGLERLPRTLQVLVEGVLRHAGEIVDLDGMLQRLARGERS